MYNHFQEAQGDSTSSSDFFNSMDHSSARCHSGKAVECLGLKTDLGSVIGSPWRSRSSSPLSLRSEQLRASLLQNFEAAFLLANDGNSFYRLVGIEHIKHMINNKESLEEFRTVVCQQRFDLTLLQDAPKRCTIPAACEVLATVERIVSELGHHPCGDFAERMIGLMVEDPNIDFSIVVAYRLYTYFVGYRHIESELSMLLEGNEEAAILTYGAEVTPLIIKIIAESLSARIAIFTVMDDEIELTSIGLAFSEFHKFELSLMLLNNGYNLLVEKAPKCEPKFDRREGAARQGARRQPAKVQVPVEDFAAEVGELDHEFFEEIYASLPEEERKAIVLEYIRENYSISH